MITIGDFAKLGRVSVRMLRHYDSIGLLTPLRTDPHTGYRYYEVSQLQRLNRVIALKDLGLRLEEVPAWPTTPPHPTSPRMRYGFMRRSRWPASPSPASIPFDIPGGDVASLIHRGSMDTIDSTYQELNHWVCDQGFTLKGQAREVYLEMSENQADWVTEVHVDFVR